MHCNHVLSCFAAIRLPGETMLLLNTRTRLIRLDQQAFRYGLIFYGEGAVRSSLPCCNSAEGLSPRHNHVHPREEICSATAQCLHLVQQKEQTCNGWVPVVRYRIGRLTNIDPGWSIPTHPYQVSPQYIAGLPLWSSMRHLVSDQIHLLYPRLLSDLPSYSHIPSIKAVQPCLENPQRILLLETTGFLMKVYAGTTFGGGNLNVDLDPPLQRSKKYRATHRQLHPIHKKEQRK
jgi:hypothetical protein